MQSLENRKKKSTAKTAVVYARVSDRKQVEKEISIPEQINQGKEKAESLGATVAGVFKDEGKTGTNSNRPEFLAAIEMAITLEADYFICWSTSRFARNRFDTTRYKHALGEIGCRVVYVTLDLAADAPPMIEGFFELYDEHKSWQTSVDTKRSMLRNAKDGYFNGGRPPFGYQAVKDAEKPNKKRLAPVPEEKILVREIFRLRKSGIGCKQIAVALNDRGSLNRGKDWSNATVSYLLRNPAVKGYSVFGRRTKGIKRPESEWVQILSHEPIIEQAAWDSIQSAMDKATNSPDSGSPKSRWVFTGTLRCQCGGALRIETAKGRSGRYSYYRCQAAQKKGQCTDQRRRADLLEPWLLKILFSRLLTEQAMIELASQIQTIHGSWAKQQADALQEKEKQHQKLKKANANLFSILELHGIEAPNLGDISERLRDNKNRMAELETQIAVAKSAEPPEIKPKDARDIRKFIEKTMIKTENNKKTRAFIQSFVESIELSEGVATIRYKPESLFAAPLTGAVHSNKKWLPENQLLGTITVTVPMPDDWAVAA